MQLPRCYNLVMVGFSIRTVIHTCICHPSARPHLHPICRVIWSEQETHQTRPEDSNASQMGRLLDVPISIQGLFCVSVEFVSLPRYSLISPSIVGEYSMPLSTGCKQTNHWAFIRIHLLQVVVRWHFSWDFETHLYQGCQLIVSNGAGSSTHCSQRLWRLDLRQGCREERCCWLEGFGWGPSPRSTGFPVNAHRLPPHSFPSEVERAASEVSACFHPQRDLLLRHKQAQWRCRVLDSASTQTWAAHANQHYRLSFQCGLADAEAPGYWIEASSPFLLLLSPACCSSANIQTKNTLRVSSWKKINK